MGVLLFALVAHRFPFDSVHSIRTSNYVPSRRFSSSLTAVIASMLQVDPARRVTCKQLLKAAWFSK
jgi:serine/threonine protein kinase